MPITNLPEEDQNRASKLQSFDRLLTMMDELRLNCPWDKKQTFQSLRHLSIEEVYELSDAILEEDEEEIKNELGDLLLHLVFYSRIAQENKTFHIGEVIEGVIEKMTRRHPHIYGDVEVQNEEDVKKNWEQIKLAEKKDKRVLEGVPASLPALVKAIRIQEKARGAGFDWEYDEQVWAKVKEEIEEFEQETDLEKKEKEFGDILFSLVNYARHVGINPEQALEKTNKKFTSRFNYVEEKAKANQQSLAEMSLEEMDIYWEEAKKLEK